MIPKIKSKRGHGLKSRSHVFTRLGLVVDIGPGGEVIPRWQEVSIFTPVIRSDTSGPIAQLGLAAN